METLLLLASVWPEPASSAAGSRTLQLLTLFPGDPWRVVILCAAERRAHSAPLPDRIETGPLLLNDSRMDAVFRDLEPDVVLFDRFPMEEQYGWRVEKQCPGALRILDTVDLHSLREIRQRIFRENRRMVPEDWNCEAALRELASIYRSDLTLLISDAERDLLVQDLKLPGSLLHVLPFLLDPEEIASSDRTPGYHQRSDFVTIGNFRHPPNADSVWFLHEEIWPRLREACPEANLKIYGADLTPDLQQLHRPEEGFHLCGRADDAREVMRNARVCLAPLRYGAGLKGKLLDAMCAGTPSVTTPIGAEGMQGDLPWPGHVAASPDGIVEAAVRLYRDQAAWREARGRILPLLKERFDRSRHAPGFQERLQEMIRNPPPFSADRLTGSLLRHHHQRSTEFMSRWIEAKNASSTT